MWEGSFSQALENMVFLELLRRFPRVRYYLTRSKRQDVDFVTSDERGRPLVAVQVCQDLSLPETMRREVEPLVATAKYFGIKENLIVTLGREQVIKDAGVTVRVVPAWQWLQHPGGG